MKINVKNLFPKKKENSSDITVSVNEKFVKKPEGADDSKPVAELTTVCPKCKQEFKKAEVKDNMNVCMACGHHYVISAERRVRFLVDKGTFKPLKCKVAFANPLEYPDYEEKIEALKDKTGLDEAVYTGVGKIDGMDVVIAVMSSKFLMGSMGIAVGEKVTNAFEYADRKKLPIVVFCASGGARM